MSRKRGAVSTDGERSLKAARTRAPSDTRCLGDTLFPRRQDMEGIVVKVEQLVRARDVKDGSVFSTRVGESRSDGVGNASLEVFGCQEVLGRCPAMSARPRFVCGQVSYDSIRGLAAASRRVGEAEGTFGGGDGRACIVR